MAFTQNVALLRTPVSTYTNLPVSGNIQGDIRITLDTGSAYTWMIASPTGSLTDWNKITSSSFGDLPGAPISTGLSIDNAVKVIGSLAVNIALLAFNTLVDYSATIAKMFDGIVNKFEGNENGIDTVASLNEYWAYGGFYIPYKNDLDAGTTFLLHGDGIQGSTNFQDLLRLPLIISGASVDTAIKKFDTGSIKFDGVNDYIDLGEMAGNSLPTTPADNLSWDFWYYSNASGSQPIVSSYGNALAVNDRFVIEKTAANKIQFTVKLVTGYDINNDEILETITALSTSTISNGVWNHIAVQYAGGYLQVWINGVLEDTSDSPITGEFQNHSVNHLYIGKQGTSYLNGYLDEFRTSNLVRYTTTFTPMTRAYNSSVTPVPTPTLIDSSSTPHTIVANGNSRMSGANPLFGNSSLYLDGSTNTYVATSDSSFDFSDGVQDGTAWTVKISTSNGGDAGDGFEILNGKVYCSTDSGKLFEWDGASSWVQKAPNVGDGQLVYDLQVFNGKIYGITYGLCKLLEWNGTNAWVVKAGQFGSGINGRVLGVHNGKLYGGTRQGGGYLLEWDGTSSWIQKAAPLNSEAIGSICSYNGKLYAGTFFGGRLYEWNGTNAWVEKAPLFLNAQYIEQLIVFNGKLYGADGNTGKLLEWNDSNAWVQRAGAFSGWAQCHDLVVYNGELFGSSEAQGKLAKWNGTNAWIEKAPLINGDVNIAHIGVLNNKIYGLSIQGGRKSLLEWSSTPATTFTVDFWVNPNQYDDLNAFLIGQNDSWKVTLDGTSNHYPKVTIVGGATVIATTGLSTETWNHIAVVQSLGTLKIYVNGILGGSVVSTVFTNGTVPLTIGATNTGANKFNGYFEEIRVSTLARWTANFTPAVVEYTSDPNTKLLVHANTQVILNMTLQSIGYVANYVPTSARVVVFEEDIDVIEQNVDLTVEVSRDGGTTFTPCLIKKDMEFVDGKLNLFTGTVDLSSQPNGLLMVWRVKTLNNKDCRIRGISLSWK